MTRKELKKLVYYECHCSLFGGMLLPPERHSVFLYRKSQYHASSKGIWHKLLKHYYSRKLVHQYGILASPYATIGKGLRFVHPTSIVIGSHVNAGENLHLYQNVTLGGARLGDVARGYQPTIGNNVTVFSGAAILGKISVGNNVIVAANSTLLSDAPQNSVCVGSPARIIRK